MKTIRNPSVSVPGDQHRNQMPLADGNMKRPKWTAQRKRRVWTAFTFFPCVIIPLVLSIIYYAGYASDRYAVETKFSIRSPSGIAPTDILGLMSGVSTSGSTSVDSYIVSDFIESRDLLDKLEKRIDLRGMFDTDKADFLTRFDSTKSQEDFVKYLSRMISVYYDSSSQIITLEVQTFTPEDAQLLATEIIFLSDQLINEISERSRRDTVSRAEGEVRRAEELLRQNRAELSGFRELQQDIDPTKSVEAQQILLGGIESELLARQSERTTLLEFLKNDAPRIRMLDSQISALEGQVVEQKARFGIGDDASKEGSQTLTARVSAYEELAVDLEFRERAYISALVSLESARLEADRQQRYLASFVLPSKPQKALYPQRTLNVFIIFIFSLMFWGICVMMTYIVREHMA